MNRAIHYTLGGASGPVRPHEADTVRGMATAQPHGWRECQPALLAGPKATPAERERAAGVVQRVWSGLSDHERMLFHQFTCYSRQTPEHLALMERFAEAIRA